MRKIHIWLFITKLFFFAPWMKAQEVGEELSVVEADQKREKKPYTIRFGLDLSKPVMAQLDKDYFGLEFVGDIRLFKEIYGSYFFILCSIEGCTRLGNKDARAHTSQ